MTNLIAKLEIPLNHPFDHHVMRPARGRAVVTLPGGLEIVVLGPEEDHLAALYQVFVKEARKIDGTIDPLNPETFSRLAIEADAAPLRVAEPPRPLGPDCRPSENAGRLAGGAYLDESVSNLASTVLLFRFRQRTFLYTGDSRGDLILEGLSRAGLLNEQGEASVDLMTVPHLGSDRNVTVDFFKRVKASGYLFSGDGTHGNPAVATVAALVGERGVAGGLTGRRSTRPAARRVLQGRTPLQPELPPGVPLLVRRVDDHRPAAPPPFLRSPSREPAAAGFLFRRVYSRVTHV
jgi:hypothetical protein